MINLKKKIEEDSRRKSEGRRRLGTQASVRMKLLTKEVQDLGVSLPKTCKIDCDDVNDLKLLLVTTTPDEGYWKGGSFVFDVYIPEEYNLQPPTVTCKTRLWHPNITENGEICLSLLRESAPDGSGWSPCRTLKDIVWGINSLFTDLLNFDDPLNKEAADLYSENKDMFAKKVKDYIHRYCQPS